MAVWVVIATLVGLKTSHAQHDGETLTLEEYQARITQFLWAFDRVEDSGATLLATAHQSFEAIKWVTLPSGERISVQSPLTDIITKTQAVERLSLLQQQLAAANDQTAARLGRLQAIFERPEFTHLIREPGLWERFVRWLTGLLPDTTEASNNAERLFWRVIIWGGAALGIVLVTLILSYWLQGFLSNFVADAETRRRKASGEEIPLTAAQARLQARSLAQSGSYRQAVRHLYLSALLELEERGLVRHDRSLTNREYLAQTSVAPVREHLQPVVDTFDQVWYGVREPDAQTFETYEQEIDQIREATRTVRQAVDNPASGRRP